ncbi:THO complex subunit 4D [Camellia lanceoleosa]|uniref:THO complex subunit 4D n=1 Tax=Camellia lanceoleosa TaxID=1840588 RepID=A0ACC0IYA4_9ERIC|nr:THO complex subunit 4D [Camellia lanceoleosa]
MPSSDMLLDDMINHMRNSGRGRGQGRARRGRGLGGSFKGGMTGAPHRGPHRGPLRVNAQPSSNAIAKSFRGAKSFPWRHDLFADSLRAAGLTGVENGTKLFISNLDIGVTNEDIRELFSEIGKLKRYAVHYDKNGRSSGSAEVVFARRSDALRALKRYNSVQLDGKPMKVEIIGTHSEIPVSAHVNVVGGVNRRRRVVMIQRNRGDLMNGRGRGRGRTGGRGRGGGGGRKKAVEKTYDELDKELENYHADAMHT